MRIISCSVILVLLFIQCGTKNAEKDNVSTIETKGYYSDYFVFIADDGEGPLVVPIDINWSLHTKGYEIEYKGWFGTTEDWPIQYFKRNIPAKQSEIPKEAFEHLKTENFNFNRDTRSIATKINGAHEIQIEIPKKEKWVLPNLESEFPTYAFKTAITVDGKSRSGWMLYERIRFDELKKFEGFEAFYWMPIIVEGDLLHFTQHRGKQTAVKWSTKNDTIITETASDFVFNIIETIADTKSKREKIAKTVQIQVSEWELDVTLKSTGHQIGYGSEHPKGLAVFRQSLLKSSEQSKDYGYGMMELILADD